MKRWDPEYEKARYTRRNILRSEAIYGKGFQSPGGVEAVAWCCREAKLPLGLRILEIGSGLGGAAFFFHDQYDARVVGLDISPSMIALSNERMEQRHSQHITFMQSDILSTSLEAGSFDLVWSRDSLMYETRKLTTFVRARVLLNETGQLIVSDFCRGGHAEDFDEYVSVAGYDLISVSDYADVIREAGFEITLCRDISAWSMNLLIKNLYLFEKNKEIFMAEYTDEDHQYIVERWHAKIDFMRRGLLTEGLFIASAAGPV